MSENIEIDGVKALVIVEFLQKQFEAKELRDEKRFGRMEKTFQDAVLTVGESLRKDANSRSTIQESKLEIYLENLQKIASEVEKQNKICFLRDRAQDERLLKLEKLDSKRVAFISGFGAAFGVLFSSIFILIKNFL